MSKDLIWQGDDIGSSGEKPAVIHLADGGHMDFADAVNSLHLFEDKSRRVIIKQAITYAYYGLLHPTDDLAWQEHITSTMPPDMAFVLRREAQ